MGQMESDIEIDVCGLEPPEPMERVLDALSGLKQGQRLRMLIDREPKPLYRILDNNGYVHEVQVLPGYLYEILLWHRS